MKLPRLFTGKRRGVFMRLVANGVAQAAMAAALALLIRRSFDALLAAATPGLHRGVWSGLALAALAVLATAALRRRERIDGEILAQSYAHRLRRAMYARLCATGPFELQRLSRGAVLLRFLNDLTAISQWVSQGLARFLVAAVTGAVALAALAFVQWQLVLLVVVILTLGITATLSLGRHFDLTVRAARERRTYLASNIAEKVSALAVVHAFGQTGREQQRLRRQSRRLKTALIRRANPAGSMTAVAEATAGLAVIGALSGGVLAVAWQIATPGTVLAFVATVGLLTAPVREIGRAYEYWLRARISREKLAAFLAGVRTPRGGRDLDPGPGRLDIQAISWGEALRDASASAAPRSRIALLGESGAGKSALLYVAAGLLKADAGQVALDGQNLAEVAPNSLRRAIGLVSPDLPLLRGSIDDNLRYGAPDATPESLARLEQLCDMAPVLDQLPDGRHTRVVEGGRNLSLGQRQRIALVRALLGEPRLLLLDDVDQALDAGLKAVLLRVMDRYRGTVVMVTRDSDLMATATSTWELASGGIRVAPGPARERRGVAYL